MPETRTLPDAAAVESFVPRPGRPKGSGLDDTRHLAAIAALLGTGAEATVTGAIRRVTGDEPATVRRLQRKFADSRDALMAAYDATANAIRDEHRRRMARGFHQTLAATIGLAAAAIAALWVEAALAAGVFLVSALICGMLSWVWFSDAAVPRLPLPRLRTILAAAAWYLGPMLAITALGAIVRPWIAPGATPFTLAALQEELTSSLVAVTALGFLLLVTLVPPVADAAGHRIRRRSFAAGIGTGLAAAVVLSVATAEFSAGRAAEEHYASSLATQAVFVALLDRVPEAEREAVRERLVIPALRALGGSVMTTAGVERGPGPMRRRMQRRLVTSDESKARAEALLAPVRRASGAPLAVQPPGTAR